MHNAAQAEYDRLAALAYCPSDAISGQRYVWQESKRFNAIVSCLARSRTTFGKRGSGVPAVGVATSDNMSVAIGVYCGVPIDDRLLLRVHPTLIYLVFCIFSILP
jgi:hypothetical protein